MLIIGPLLQNITLFVFQSSKKNESTKAYMMPTEDIKFTPGLLWQLNLIEKTFSRLTSIQKLKCLLFIFGETNALLKKKKAQLFFSKTTNLPFNLLLFWSCLWMDLVDFVTTESDPCLLILPTDKKGRRTMSFKIKYWKRKKKLLVKFPNRTSAATDLNDIDRNMETFKHPNPVNLQNCNYCTSIINNNITQSFTDKIV